MRQLPPNERGNGLFTFRTNDIGTPCDKCKALDGKTDTLENLARARAVPPLHRNCRCRLVRVRGVVETPIVERESQSYNRMIRNAQNDSLTNEEFAAYIHANPSLTDEQIRQLINARMEQMRNSQPIQERYSIERSTRVSAEYPNLGRTWVNTVMDAAQVILAASPFGLSLLTGCSRVPHPDELRGSSSPEDTPSVEPSPGVTPSPMPEVTPEVEDVPEVEDEKLTPGTGTMSPHGKALLLEYENMGQGYMIYEDGKLVAILSRDIEGRGNITYGYGVLFHNTQEDRRRLREVYGLEFGERVRVPIDIAERMYQDYIDTRITGLLDFTGNNRLWLTQNQMDALIMHRYLRGNIGEKTRNLLIEMFKDKSYSSEELKLLFRDRLFEAMFEDLRDDVNEHDFERFRRGWTNRILDELELFFEGDNKRNH